MSPGCTEGRPEEWADVDAGVPAATPDTPELWTVTAPDGRRWQHERLADATVAATLATVQPSEFMERLTAAINGPELDRSAAVWTALQAAISTFVDRYEWTDTDLDTGEPTRERPSDAELQLIEHAITSLLTDSDFLEAWTAWSTLATPETVALEQAAAAPALPAVGNVWNLVAVAGLPPCNDESVFIGINTAGYVGAFNHVQPDGLCLMKSPEGAASVMSDLKWWTAHVGPAPASVARLGQGQHNGGGSDVASVEPLVIAAVEHPDSLEATRAAISEFFEATDSFLTEILHAARRPTAVALTDEEFDALANRTFKDYMEDRNDCMDRAFGRAVEQEVLERLGATTTQRATTNAAKALTFADLRAANVARCLKWHPMGLSSWSPSDWMTAIVGELGELASLVKMRNRERDGLPGNRFSPVDKQLADEAADVAIYLDLFCAEQEIDLAAAIVSKFNEVSERVGFPDRLPPATLEGA